MAVQGDESAETQALVGTVDELLASLQVPANDADRLRIMRRLPELIERVQQGMHSQTYGAGPIGKSEVCLRSFARKIRALTPEARLHKTPPAGWSKA